MSNRESTFLSVCRRVVSRLSMIPLFSFFLILAFRLCASVLSAEAETPENEFGSVPESKNQIISLSDEGVQPLLLKMKKEDSIVFFLNESTDSLITLSVDFKNRTTHCASTNLKIRENGIISSIRPLEPKNFASVCFHDSGAYPFKILGLKENPKGIEGIIEVQ